MQSPQHHNGMGRKTLWETDPKDSYLTNMTPQHHNGMQKNTLWETDPKDSYLTNMTDDTLSNGKK